jgi:5-methylcytosine-specific restriction endonuclease McrA
LILNQSGTKNNNREPIPQDIMDKVWNRDSGQCVRCGSQENLEFDHIIPFSKGGANTYRNLQILCKKCNLEKSNNIG